MDNEHREISPGVWQTPSRSRAEAAWRDMIDAGEHGPKAQTKMIDTLEAHIESARAEALKDAAERQWISVKDRLPEADFSLVCWEYLDTNERYVTIDHLSEYTSHNYFIGVCPINDESMRFRKMIAWMPLPEPPTILADKQEGKNAVR